MRPDSSIRWRCRRGILEMDLLLQAFVNNYFDKLTADEVNAFEQLLGQTDPDIMDWITGRADPPSAAIKTIIELINKTKVIQPVSGSQKNQMD